MSMIVSMSVLVLTIVFVFMTVFVSVIVVVVVTVSLGSLCNTVWTPSANDCIGVSCALPNWTKNPWGCSRNH